MDRLGSAPCSTSYPEAEPSFGRRRTRNSRRRRAPDLMGGMQAWSESTLGVGLALVLLIATSGQALAALEDARAARNPLASHGMPIFITAPGATDVLLVIMAVVLVAAVLGAGVFFFWLHSLPERLVHNSTKVHFDIVAVLGLLALFTHIHLFWVVALLLALIKIPNFSIPDFTGLLGRIAAALERRSAPDATLPPRRTPPA